MGGEAMYWFGAVIDVLGIGIFVWWLSISAKTN